MAAMREAFLIWREELLNSRSIAPLNFGATREALIAMFGPPDLTSVVTRNRRWSILKYSDIEFHFDHQSGSRLFLIYGERDDGSPLVALRDT
jgi:hypothetical protein